MRRLWFINVQAESSGSVTAIETLAGAMFDQSDGGNSLQTIRKKRYSEHFVKKRKRSALIFVSRTVTSWATSLAGFVSAAPNKCRDKALIPDKSVLLHASN